MLPIKAILNDAPNDSSQSASLTNGFQPMVKNESGLMVTPSSVSIQKISPSEADRRKRFMEELGKYMDKIGKPLSKIPIMGYKELDLFQFFAEVMAFGGYNEVITKIGTWSKIWKKLDNYDTSITDSSFRLKKNYERFLLDYEYFKFPSHKPREDVSAVLHHRTDVIEDSFIPENRPKSIPKPKMHSTIKDVPRDNVGKPILPLVLSEVTIHSLGRIIPVAPYMTEKHVWPVGFMSSRMFSSMIDPRRRVKYVSQIVDTGERPQFIVTASDDPKNPIVSNSPSSAWRTVLKKVLGKTPSRDSRTNITVSGALRFGLAHPTVCKLLSELPNSERCQKLGKRRLEGEESYDYPRSALQPAFKISKYNNDFSTESRMVMSERPRKDAPIHFINVQIPSQNLNFSKSAPAIIPKDFSNRSNVKDSLEKTLDAAQGLQALWAQQ